MRSWEWMLRPSWPPQRRPSCFAGSARRSRRISGEHKTKRSDLLAVLGRPTQEEPFYYHDLHKANRPVGSLDAKILKSPVRICAFCNNTRTQPHDRAWEHLSDRLRSRRLKIGLGVRANRVFPHFTKREMLNVHLFFVKLFGCMLAEARANGFDLPIDIDPFSRAINVGSTAFRSPSAVRPQRRNNR